MNLIDNKIFQHDENNNIIFYKWGGISKPVIVNDESKQIKIIKLIDARNIFFDYTSNYSILGFLFILIFWPILLVFTPLIYLYVLIGAPIFFSLHYLLPSFSNYTTIGISIIIVTLIITWDYSNQIDKILRD